MATNQNIERQRFAIGGRLTRAVAIALGVAAILAVVPVGAQAATTARMTSIGNAFVTSGNEANTVQLTDIGSEIWVLDSTAAVHAGKGCVSYDLHQAYCPYPPGPGGRVWQGLFVVANGGNDHITLHRFGIGYDPLVALNGNEGRDIILGSRYREGISGGGGDDLLTPFGGRDEVWAAGEGADGLFVRDGEQDVVHCDPSDRVERDKVDTVIGC